jgi:hypothetical protein
MITNTLPDAQRNEDAHAAAMTAPVRRSEDSE